FLKNHFGDLPKWIFAVFGTGPLENELKAKCSSLGLNSEVLWMGYRNGLGSELAGLDVLIALSDGEGLPINLIESGWAGTPAVATTIDGIVDLIPNSSYGVLVRREDDEKTIASKLAKILADAALRREMGLRFQARVETE